MTFYQQHKQTIWIAAAVIAVIIILIVVGYYWGKGKGQDAVAPKIPGEQQADGTVIQKELTDTERQTVNDLAKRLQSDIYSWFGTFSRDTAAYYNLRDMTDRLFVATANQYRSLTQSNLFSDIENETSFNPFLVDATRLILERAQNLKLK